MRPQSSEAQRAAYATEIMTLAGVEDARIEACFSMIPREAFLPPPPWTVIEGGVASTTSEVGDVYRNVLVALDRRLGINNGEPSLHAAWLAAVGPRPGERVVHVGAGGGYYTAMLAKLVAPGGQVDAFEVHEGLAADASRHLAGDPSVTVRCESAFGRPLPEADVIYVNAGVFSPDPAWLRALRPGGRLVFPWQPASRWGPAMLVTRRGACLAAVPIMDVGFITCSGQGRGQTGEIRAGLQSTRSVWLSERRPPDETATAIYDEVWFSSVACT